MSGKKIPPRHTRRTWFQARAARPCLETDCGHIVSERAKFPPQRPTAATGPWEEVGPTNVGGRATALACHPKDTQRVWLGTAGGGVWFTQNGGVEWKPQWHSEGVLNVGSLAIDPNSPDTLYCGTGEANLSLDSYPGIGLFATTDGGCNWKLIADARAKSVPTRIGTIAVDPFDSNHIMLGGVGDENATAAQSAPGGLYSSSDGGETWRCDHRIFASSYCCHSIVFDPVRRDVVFAAIVADGAASGIYRSADRGMNWYPLKTGDRFGRTALAVSPKDPARLYAIAADQASSNHDNLFGVFRSDDGGMTWRDMADGWFVFRGEQEEQMSYGCTIVVHPTDPDVVVCGGVDLHCSRNGGTTWEWITDYTAECGTPRYAHADHHALLMPASRPGLIYDANDGGMDVSTDCGANWTNRSKTLATVMFYDFDVAQSCVSVFGGGAQDNGTLVTRNGATNKDKYDCVLGGDGGWILFDPLDDQHYFASKQGFAIYRWRNGDKLDVSPPATSEDTDNLGMAYMILDPNDATTVLAGARRVWRTTNDGVNWEPLSRVLDGGKISAIEIAPSDSRTFFVGTEKGGVFRSTDAGANWSDNIGPRTGRVVSRIDAHPTDAQKLFLCVEGTGCPHVFYSCNGGTNWKDIGKRLPDVPHHAVLVRPDNTDEVYVANDAGVFMTTDLGRNWRNISDNLPTSMYVDLVYRGRDRTLFAATYGRGAWARVLCRSDNAGLTPTGGVVSQPPDGGAVGGSEGRQPSQA